MKTWEQENDYIIENILEDFFIQASNKHDGMGVELQITPECNQKCEYCYLYKNKDLIYPKEIRDPKLILKNLNIILNYFLEKEYQISEIDLFSGEIWASDFGIKVLQGVLYYVSKAKFKPRRVSIPSNGSFILSEKYFKQILEIKENFAYYNCNLAFSISVDGPIIENDNRSFVNDNKNIVRDDSFYEKLFKFGQEYDYGFHPMVNAYSIENWPDQYDWWIKKLKEYNLDYFSYIMFLEVRNNEWTDAKIENYLKFINHSVDTVVQEVFENNLENFLNTSLGIAERKNKYNYFHLSLAHSSNMNGCSVDRTLQFRLGDLAWTMCHRTSYEKFLYGKFKVENNKIVGMEALNLPLLFIVYRLTYKGHPECDVCPINKYCIRGCYGAQFEAHKELFYPCETVCNLFKAKTYFLYKKYRKMSESLNNKKINSILDKIEKKLAEEKEIADKWINVVNTII